MRRAKKDILLLEAASDALGISRLPRAHRNGGDILQDFDGVLIDFFFDRENMLIGNFDAHLLLAPILHEAVFNANTYARIRNQVAHRGETKLTGTVPGFDALAEEVRIFAHGPSLGRAGTLVNSTGVWKRAFYVVPNRAYAKENAVSL